MVEILCYELRQYNAIGFDIAICSEFYLTFTAIVVIGQGSEVDWAQLINRYVRYHARSDSLELGYNASNRRQEVWYRPSASVPLRPSTQRHIIFIDRVNDIAICLRGQR